MDENLLLDTIPTGYIVYILVVVLAMVDITRIITIVRVGQEDAHA